MKFTVKTSYELAKSVKRTKESLEKLEQLSGSCFFDNSKSKQIGLMLLLHKAQLHECKLSITDALTTVFINHKNNTGVILDTEIYHQEYSEVWVALENYQKSQHGRITEKSEALLKLVKECARNLIGIIHDRNPDKFKSLHGNKTDFTESFIKQHVGDDKTIQNMQPFNWCMFCYHLWNYNLTQLDN